MIAIPTIHKRHFKEMMSIYDAVSENYNREVKAERAEGDLSRNPLRAAHREVYIQLLNYLVLSFERQYITLQEDERRIAYMRREVSDIPRLMTNTVTLCNRTKRSYSTVYRLLLRLQQAGIISKKCHGPENPIEILFSWDMILFSDLADPNYMPIPEILARSENQVITACIQSICPQSNNTKTFKNKVIQEQGVESDSRQMLKKNKQEHFYKNTPSPEGEFPAMTASDVVLGTKINDLRTEPQKTAPNVIPNAFGVVVTNPKINDPHKTYIQKLQDSRDAYQKRLERYVSFFVSYLISMLYEQTGRKVYDGERLNCYKIAEMYFEREARSSVKACDIRWEELKRRIDIVKRQVDVGKWSPMVGPAWYINPENATGFRATKRWLKDDERFRKLQLFNRRRTTNESKLQAALNNLVQHDTIAMYESGIQYLQKKAPSMVDTYKLHAMAYMELRTQNLNHDYGDI